MAKKKLKVLIADDRPQAIDALRNMLPQQNITIVADSQEATQRAGQEEFDLIITAYAIPAVSGLEGITGSKLSEGQVIREKAAIFKELRKMAQEAEAAVQSQAAAHVRQILMESKARQEKILEVLNDHVRQSDTEGAELKYEVQRLQGELERAGEEAALAAGEFTKKIEALTRDLKETGAQLEAARQEKAETTGEISRLWEETARTVADLQQQLSSEREQALAEMEAARREKAEIKEEFERVQKESAQMVEELTRKTLVLEENLAAALARNKKAAQKISWQEEEIVRLQEAAKNRTELQAKVKSMTTELQEAAAAAEGVLAEKVKVEEKLQMLQQNWEKYVSGS